MTRTFARRPAWGVLVPMLAAAAWAVAGCGKSDSDSGAGRTRAPVVGTAPGGANVAGKGGKAPKLLFITNGNSDWWNAVETGMQDGGKEFGADAKMRRNNGEVQGQVDRLKEALSLPGIQGVAVSVLEADAPGVLDALAELKKAGKHVITIDSDVAPAHASLREGYIGTDNAKAGEVAGKATALLRPEGGKVVAFVGTFAAANARDRRDGFLAGAGDKFVLTPAQQWQDNTDPNLARSNVQSAITKTPDAAILLGLYSYNAPAIAQEVAAAPEVRKKLNVVTFDLDEAAVGHLEQGNIDVSVCQNPYEMGYQGVKLLKALIDKDEAAVKEILPDGSSRDTGVRVIVPKADSPVKAMGKDVITVDEMKTWLQSKGLKSS